MKQIYHKILLVGAAIWFPLMTMAQDLNISGTLTDNNGEPVVGASVVVKGTTNGVTTDINGNYDIAAPADAALTFSFLGLETKEEAVGGRARIDVVLGSSDKSLEEVVVIGYGSQKRQNLTGAVNQVDGSVLDSRPLTNIGQGLQGMIPNLQINAAGTAPGQGSQFNIRGYTSLNGGSPLVLVDGVVQDPNLVNPQDIESVTVIKDGSAAAIYGARAAYGVILFTTKSGKRNQKPQVNVAIAGAVSAPVYVPKYMDSWNYVTYMNTAQINNGGTNYFPANMMEKIKAYYDDPVNNLPVWMDNGENGEYTTQGRYTYVGNTDWASELYKNGGLQTYDISLSGGSENSQYYLSYGLMNQQGVLAAYDDKYQRHTVSMDASSDLRKWLTVSAKAKYTYGNGDHPSGGLSNSGLSWSGGMLKNDLRPLMPVKHPDGNYAGQGSFTNPFAVGALGGYNLRKTNDLWVTGKVQLRPLEGLNVNADLTFNPYSFNNTVVVKSFEEYRANGSHNPYPWTNPNQVYEYNTNDYYTAVNAYADYTKTIAQQNNFKLTLGYSHEVKTNRWFSAQRKNLLDNDLPVLDKASGEMSTGGSATSWAVQGVFGRLHYDFAERYLVDINGRYDGSSKFAKGNRFAFFPSVSAAWHISHEEFLSSIKNIVSDLKVRGSYSNLGNQNVNSNFPYVPGYSTSTSGGYIIDGKNGSTVTAPGLVSAGLTWETVTQYNVGIDYGFLNQRLTGAFDFFRRDTRDMLTTGQPLPGVLGTSVPQENAADLKTYGWELSIAWADKISSLDIDYHASFVLSDAQSEITKFDNPTGTLSSGHYVGKKIGEIWGYQATGLLQTDEEVAIANGEPVNGVYPAGSQKQRYNGTWNKGDIKYVDVNGDGVSSGKYTLDDHGDVSIIGNQTPRYQYGITLGAAWKGIDLEIFLQGVGKRDWFPDGRFFGINSEWDVPMALASNYWTEANTGGYLPRPYIDGAHGNRSTNSYYLQDASYLRFKQLSVGYTLPQKWTQRFSVSKLRIYVTGQNLWTWTSLSKIYDPEIVGNLYGTGAGIGTVAGAMTYPIAKTWSAGINITF